MISSTSLGKKNNNNKIFRQEFREMASLASGGGKLHAEVEVKSHADKMWTSIRHSAILFPKVMPDHYKSITILQGDGNSVGSVSLVEYGESSPLVTFSKEKIDAADEANKKLTYSIVDGDLLKYYKKFIAHVEVVPKGEGSLVKWSCEFEKAGDEVADPHVIKEFTVTTFQALDDYNLKEK